MSNITPVAVCMAKTLSDATIAILSSKRLDIKFFPIDYNKLVVPPELKQCKVLFVDPFILTNIVNQMPNLQWIQSTWAGIENLFQTPLFSEGKPPWKFTRMGGYGPLLAEFVLSQIISWERRYLDIKVCQDKKHWEKEKYYVYRPLFSLVVAILGIGDVGQEIAKMCKCFGMTVHGLLGRKKLSKDLQNFDILRSREELPVLLSECDYLINALPSTSETRGMLGKNMFQNCQKKPKFINVGRGDIANEDEIVNALDSNYLSGVTLDVFEKEPLPNFSKLWSHPKVVVTPHVAGAYLPEVGVKFFLDNLSRFEANKPLHAEVDWNLKY